MVRIYLLAYFGSIKILLYLLLLPYFRPKGSVLCSGNSLVFEYGWRANRAESKEGGSGRGRGGRVSQRSPFFARSISPPQSVSLQRQNERTPCKDMFVCSRSDPHHCDGDSYTCRRCKKLFSKTYVSKKACVERNTNRRYPQENEYEEKRVTLIPSQ
jgi:hypothetical protein